MTNATPASRSNPTNWRVDYERLSTADHTGALSPADLEQFALCAYMLGRDDDGALLWMRAHQEWLRAGQVQRAARCAFWQACGLLFRGDIAPALGWIARGRRVLEAGPEDCAEQGWLLLLTALPSLLGGDLEQGLPGLAAADAISRRFNDLDLMAFTRLCQGEALVQQQDLGPGMALLDEVMVAVTAGELSPILTGIAYCSVIARCQAVFDLRRAREWTAALTRWCAAQPDLVPFRGNCLVHRCEILHLQGAWPDALAAAHAACALLAGPPTWDSLGSAYYQLGEIQRLRGAFAQAEAAYRQASQVGREPEPGMSLLRLAQGEHQAAVAGVQRVLDEAPDLIARSRVLPAIVEIMLVRGELDVARTAAGELAQIADQLGAPYLQALAAHAIGAVLLADGSAREALPELRRASSAWHTFDAPYQVARVRVLLGCVLRDLGDSIGAGLEFDAARHAFEQLGAAPDLEAVIRLAAAGSQAAAGPLSPREREVLALLAVGKTNRAIAAALFISEKTVARHVSNIFAKLDLSTRAEATAYAHRHGLAH